MEIKYMTSQIEFHKRIEEFFNSDKEETKITVMDRTEAFYGDDGTCDTEWCDENNIPYSHNETLRGTGCIVAVKGNVIVDVKRKYKDERLLTTLFAKALTQYFQDKGLKCIRHDNNDILIDGYKTASGADAILDNGYRYMGFQISIGQDLETIRKICKKPMVKVPKALGEYGITTEEMVKFCEDFWSKN